MRARMVLRDIWQGFRLDVVNIKYSNDVLIEICKIFDWINICKVLNLIKIIKRIDWVKIIKIMDWIKIKQNI